MTYPSTSAQHIWNLLPTAHLPYGTRPCAKCSAERGSEDPFRLVVLTGGPGAGKTAVLETARASFCRHVAALPEAATIIFSGGFPRHETLPARRTAQRAIFHVQYEMERLVEEEHIAHAALCDRGIVDGIAYWPDDPDAYWRECGVRREDALARYGLVIHLRTPHTVGEYVATESRIEDIREAAEIDERILAAWDGHPNRIIIDAEHRFEDKVHAALDALRNWLPSILSAGDNTPATGGS